MDAYRYLGVGSAKNERTTNQHLVDLKAALETVNGSIQSTQAALENSVNQNFVDHLGGLKESVDAVKAAVDTELTAVNENLVQGWLVMETLNSSVGTALQNTINQHSADVKTGLEHVKGSVRSTNTTLAAVNQNLTDVNTNLRAIQTELRDNGDALRELVEREGKAAREADKMRRIEFALNNLSLVTEGFSLVERKENASGNGYRFVGAPLSGESVLKWALMFFRRDLGLVIAPYFIAPNGPATTQYYKEIDEAWYQSFRDTLSSKLHVLLGKKPRIDEHNIFYE